MVKTLSKRFSLPSSNVLPKMLSLKLTAVSPQASYGFSLIYSSWFFFLSLQRGMGEKCVFMQTNSIKAKDCFKKQQKKPNQISEFRL